MKRWPVLAAAMAAELLVLLAVLASAGAFMSTLESPDGKSFAMALLSETQRLLPLALVLLVGPCLLSFAGSGANRIIAVAATVIFGSLLGAGGVVAGRFVIEKGSPSPPRPVINQAVEVGRAVALVERLENKTATGLTTADFGEAFPRLSYTASAPYDALRGEVRAAGATWSLVRPTKPPSLPFAAYLSTVSIPLFDVRSDSLGSGIVRMAGLIIFAAGFACMGLLASQPISSFMVSLLFSALTIAADSMFLKYHIGSMLEGLLKPLGLSFGPVLTIAAAETMAGVLLACIGLLLAPRRRI
ncbi:MAG: hypothetical protein ACOYM2_08760 [Rectinemataceae bacterium]